MPVPPKYRPPPAALGDNRAMFAPAPAPEQVRAALRTCWQCPVDTCVPLSGGMNSSAWAVGAGPDRFVAKLVPAAHRALFVAGLLRFRWAVQADYFAYRLHVDDRTGIADAEENRVVGLADARAGLARCAEECGSA
jgi:hypothetical protein